jgi:hypothetical protein
MPWPASLSTGKATTVNYGRRWVARFPAGVLLAGPDQYRYAGGRMHSGRNRRGYLGHAHVM